MRSARNDMSDLELTRAQRARLRAGDLSPLDFPYETDEHDKPLPQPCHEGDRCVLAWTQGTPVWEPGYGMKVPQVPLLYVTVTSVQRHRKGFWRVRFDVTDLRDPDVFLRRGGGDSPVDELAAGAKPPRWWVDARAKAIGEFSHAERLKRHAEERRERGQARVRRAA